MLLRIVTVAMMLLALVPAFAQTPDDAAANRLFVEAVKARDEAMSLSPGEVEIPALARRRDLLALVDKNLREIVDRHPGSGLAVRLVLGEEIGGRFSLRRAALEVADARVQLEAGGALANPASRVGRVFRNCLECPEMVVVPAGRASLASGHDVTIAAPFAVGKFEVTFAEWDACVADSGCTHRSDDQGWGRSRQPVMNVSWDDAQQYVAWLSRKTGKSYRLLSEAEWEYAAQAGSGREQVAQNGANEANCDGCGSPWDRRQTAPVGSFAANAFGLHDMLGNVWEWTADCWNQSHSGAATDGSARMTGECLRRVLRGGSWVDDPWIAGSATRFRYTADYRSDSLGFRVARTL